MSIFSTILEKLGLGNKDQKDDKKENEVHATPKPAAAPKPDVPYTPPPSAASTAQASHKPAATHTPPAHGNMNAATPKPAPAAPKPAEHTGPRTMLDIHNVAHEAPEPAALAPKPVEAVPLVDVKAKLEAMADKMDPKPNWKASIADLLFLLGMDHSYQARKELAIELGCPEKLMGDSAQMNMWLHKTVLTKIAENGGNIPKELLDN